MIIQSCFITFIKFQTLTPLRAVENKIGSEKGYCNLEYGKAVTRIKMISFDVLSKLVNIEIVWV